MSEEILISVYSGKTISKQCGEQMHPLDEVNFAKGIVEECQTIDLYSNSPDFVMAIKYIAEKNNIKTEFYLDGVSHGTDIEPLFEDFNKAITLLDDICN